MIGETILHYKMIEKLGEGGMGEVFKAQDTKLDRFVALKFLPSQLTASEDDKARFIQEAKAASAMNHPNVCTIYDIQENNGQLFIVMEFVDGKTLKDLVETPRQVGASLPEKQILEIGIQVAEGLAAAHEKGIVHRDIKPENIMIRKDGIVQIMDFGLAKLRETSGVSRLTKVGTTMGTMGYMSPEQVQGLDVDHRTDIFSLGVVLYEMLAGESPFKGMHETAIMYEIVNVDTPPISSIKEGFDPQLDETILECLEKDKDERCQSAKELAKDLRKIKKSTGHRKSRVYSVNTKSFQTPPSSISESGATTLKDIPVKSFFSSIFYNPKLAWSFGIIFFIAAVLLLVSSFHNQTKVEVYETKSSILPPHGINFDNSRGSNLTISPNGQFISFVGSDSSGTDKLWVRPVNSLTARPLTNVTTVAYPFWSPDSKTIAYFDKGKLMKISLDAGTPLPICDAASGRGGSWSTNGTIVFSPTSTGGLFEVPASGGKPKEIIKSDTSNPNQSLRWTYFLPDGNHFLYSTENSATGSSPTDGIYLASLNNTKAVKLISASSNCQYADGFLLFVRQSILLAQKFNPDKLKLEGEAMPAAENIQYWDARISASFAVSQNGKLIYLVGNQNNESLVLLNKNGNEIKKLSDMVPTYSAEFSPDGSKIITDLNDPNEKKIDIWVYDLNRNVSTRLTFDKADIVPRWIPSGKQITYSSNLNGSVFNAYIKNADGSGEAKLLYKSDFTKVVTSISSDGKYFLYTGQNYATPKSGFDIFLMPAGKDKKPVTILATNFNELVAAFSPNMKWIAYQSDESGKFQIYVIPFNPNNPGGTSAKWQISVDGGVNAKWMNNGKSVYFITPDNKIMGVDVNENGSSLSPGKPYLVFEPGNTKVSNLYDINKEGTEITATIPNGKSNQSTITLVENWQKEVEGKK
jgi:serine/threonine protein kinase